MPLNWFKCPDGTVTEVEECLAGCDHRCLTTPTLKLIASEREWKGIPSTTQLLNGTMEEFLKLTQPYVVDPQGRAFLLLGVRHHQKLEEQAKKLNLPAELALTGEDRDIFDLLEPEDGSWTLTDYKCWGSYRVARALGLVKSGTLPDPSGAKYKTTGSWGKAGSPKMITTYTQLPNAVDNVEAELQLNRYRILLEQLGLQIGKMQLQVTVRDGGLAVASSRGVTTNIYLIDIPRLDDEDVVGYFQSKQQDLLTALDKKEWNTPCNERESWEGRKCKEYCSVAMFCIKGQISQAGKE